MAQPPVSDVHVNRPLTNISLAYIQNATNFVASQVMPIVPVSKQSDSYYIYTKNDFRRDEMQRRAPGTESAGSGYNLSTTTYQADVWALHKDISDQEMANSDDVLDPEADATEWLTQLALIRLERQFNSDFFVAGVWGTDATGGTDFTKWSTYATSDPIGDIDTGKKTILESTGMLPNTLVLGFDTYQILKEHPDLVDRIKYTSSDSVTAQTMANLFGVNRVLVSMASYATNTELGTAAYDMAASEDDALLCYVAPNPGRRRASAGYTFMWNGVSDGLGETVGITSFYMPQLRSQRVEIQMAWDNKVIGSDLGYFFEDAVD